MYVDITGIDKKDLLRELWKRSEPAIVFLMSSVKSPEYDEENAENAINNGFIDYYSGRAIKSDIKGNKVSSDYYNKYNGGNCMEDIVKSLRDEQFREISTDATVGLENENKETNSWQNCMIS